MKKALLVLSGGQDSATCAAWAKTMFDEVMAISFNYNQRHKKELDCAQKIAEKLGMPWELIEMPVLKGNKTSGLTDSSISVNDKDEKTGLPKSFVPGRNLLFLTAAASYAISRGIYDVVTGVCQTDFSGYPDCRRITIDQVENAVHAGNREIVEQYNNGVFQIHTPLMFLTKAETVRLAARLPHGMDVVGMSWTCYEGGEVPCGVCPACELRIKGFAEAGIKDPAMS